MVIWTLLKLAAFFALILATVLGIGYLAESAGGLRLAVAGMEFSLGPLQVVVVVTVLLIGLWLSLKLAGLLFATFRFLNGDETAISRYFDRSRERRGFAALADGLLAVAEGDGRTAQARALRATRLLNGTELTGLLSAQAAEVAGDTGTASAAYAGLLADSRTRFVGLSGLLRQKIAAGDTATALKLAEKAFALKPRHVPTQDLLLDLQTRAADWKGARATLRAKGRQGLLPKGVIRRRDALLALEEARGIAETGVSIEAREAAIAANRQSPDLIPAAVLASDSYLAQGKPKLAARVLSKAWEARPHPDLAAAFAAIAPSESPEARLRRFEALFRIRPEDEETRLLKAELLIAAEDFPAARRALGDLTERHPTARALTIMAAVERGEGSDDAVVRGWLTRALTAGRGPRWICDTCRTTQPHWAAVCGSCGGFDTLSWREAEEGSARVPNGTDMLPLIVGAPAGGRRIAAGSGGEAESGPAPVGGAAPVSVEGAG